MGNKLVKDYLGNLVPKVKARSILGKYYVEGESCFLMDDGQWYRKTSTDKIVYDNYVKKYVLKVSTGSLKTGIINKQGEKGLFSDNDFLVILTDKRGTKSDYCLNEELALSLGYEESISNGNFYKDITSDDRKGWFNKKQIPTNERSKSYNLESDPDRKKELQELYEKLDMKVSTNSTLLSKFLGDYSFGCEWEVINGFVPKRVRSKYGIKALKDGSLRYDGGEGIEYVSMPMAGAKGVQLIKEFTKELSRRCEINNLCSFHIHFGNVRRDKIYVLSLYRLIELLQKELVGYFPYSRANSIKPDGKIYCKPLPDLAINYGNILKQKDEDSFQNNVVMEFNKIYSWLNHGKGLAEEYSNRTFNRETVKAPGGKKMFVDKWLRNMYTTKNAYHSIQGEKWNREERYFNVNFLNLFFTKLHTAEFRIHEGTTNSTKCLIWLLTCASILKYAEDAKKCLSAKSISLKDVLSDNLGDKYTNYIMEYYKMRRSLFFDLGRTTELKNVYREDHSRIEKIWLSEDPEFKFSNENMEIK